MKSGSSPKGHLVLACPELAEGLLFDLHGLAAMAESAVAALGHDKLRPALGANVSLAYLIRHLKSPFSEYLDNESIIGGV